MEDILGRNISSFNSDCCGFPPFHHEEDRQPFHVFWCPFCIKSPNDKQDPDAWKIEHNQREHPLYYAVSQGIITWR